MRAFMDKDFLLETETAKHLFHDYAEKLPLVDYHCHLNPKEIYEDRRFENLTELWLGGENPDGSFAGDHYKWRVMRSNGVSEEYVTGSKPAYERFLKFAESLEMAIGNPMYHWCHLELKNYFGFEGILNGKTAEEVWQLTEKKLAEADFSAKNLIRRSNVAMIGTTDDPTSDLRYHKLLADEGFEVKVLPSFRPDPALNCHKAGFVEYISKLSEASGIEINNADDVCAALTQRIEFFNERGCRASDHGLDYVMYRDASINEINDTFKRAMSGDAVTVEEREAYQTYLLLHCAREYARLGWVMQLHFSCMRNPNSKKFETLGADSGFDCIASVNNCLALKSVLNALEYEDKLPKTILYSLNPADDAWIDTLMGAFQGAGIRGKIQHGSAWWFNDNKVGMENQMTSLANLGLLGNFVGMLTDSRSFLSYARHEYFRRILCNLIGKWVEGGEYPADMDTLGEIVRDICYNNAKNYFNI